MISNQSAEILNFADVFAGCGGLSLGLRSAGWRGTFAIEKHQDAFATYHQNLVVPNGKGVAYDWPTWLPQKAQTTAEVLKQFSRQLRTLRGKVTLLAGGPPCQGFSVAGRRDEADPRNRLTEEYIQLVNIVRPRFVVLENVRGFTFVFRKRANGNERLPYATRVREMLEQAGYLVFSELIDMNNFAVPQNRKRFILVAIREGDSSLNQLGDTTPFSLLRSDRERFLASKKLPIDRPVTAREAIGDFEVGGSTLIPCLDTTLRSYRQVEYRSNGFASPFIRLMQKGAKTPPNSLRLPKHSNATVQQFERIMESCEAGRTISDSDRSRLGIRKHAITPLSPHLPSATVTTLPDDMIHYSEPRILTARENARLQTFPDTFQFSGKYTTGGVDRRMDCPRYTQIGNAVPPLFAEALGRVLKTLALA